MFPRPLFHPRFLRLAMGLGALRVQTSARLCRGLRHAPQDAWAPDLRKTQSRLNLSLLLKS